MAYDKRFKRFQEFVEGAEDWKESRCSHCKGLPGDPGSCRSCDGKGWFWQNTKTGEKDLGYGNPVKHQRVDEDGAVGVPANASGNAGVAGLGQPPGSKFGEPPGPSPLGGYTSGKKRKHYKEDVAEGFGDWLKGTQMSERDAKAVLANAKAALSVYPAKDVPKLKRLIADAERGSSGIVRLRQFLRDNGMVYEWDQAPNPIEGGEKLTELTDTETEKAAEAVHNRWVKNQKAAGETEHKSPDGKEDYMVPYDKLSDKSKEMDREAVRATLDALDLDEETFAGHKVFEVDTDKWMKSRFGKNRYHRYSRYVGEDEGGEEIRQYGRGNKKADIILKDQATGAMTWFLRRKRQVG
jgi:hypothetical protein